MWVEQRSSDAIFRPPPGGLSDIIRHEIVYFISYIVYRCG